MSRRGWSAAAVLAAWAALASAAPAGAATVERQIEATVSGAVVVEYRGDEASGCAAAGLCGFAGRATYQPGESAELFVSERTGPSPRLRGFAFLSGPRPGRVTAQVTRTLADGTTRSCADARAVSGGTELVARAGEDSVAFDLFDRGRGLDPVGTACAGPLPADLAAALPAARIPVAALRRGNATVDLRRTAPFAAGGLRGEVRSTLALRLGPSREQGRSTIRPRGRGRAPVRSLAVTYRVEQVSGTLGTQLAGRPDGPGCEALDACGLAGTLTETPGAAAGEIVLRAQGPARRRSARDLRAALGLAPGPPPPGVRSFGFGTITRPGGRVAADLALPGGPPCRDTATLGRAGLSLVPSRSGVSVSYGDFDDLEPRTRCPGLPAGSPFDARARTRIPRSALRARRLVLRLTRGASARSGPIAVTSRPDLTVVLRRTGIRERVSRR